MKIKSILCHSLVFSLLISATIGFANPPAHATAAEPKDYINALEQGTSYSAARAYLQNRNPQEVVPLLVSELDVAIKTNRAVEFQKELVKLLLYHKKALNPAAHELLKHFQSDPYLGQYISQVVSPVQTENSITSLRAELQDKQTAPHVIEFFKQLNPSPAIKAAQSPDELQKLLADANSSKILRAEAANQLLFSTGPLALIEIYDTLDDAGKVAILKTFHQSGYATACEIFPNQAEKLQVQTFLLDRFDKDPESLWPELLRSLYCFIFQDTPYRETMDLTVDPAVRDKILQVREKTSDPDVQKRCEEMITLSNGL